jgi:hypothetical protein
MMHALSARPAGGATPHAPPASGTGGTNHHTGTPGAGAAFLALLAALSDSTPGAADSSAAGAALPPSGADDAAAKATGRAAKTSTSSAQNDGATRGIASHTRKRDGKNIPGTAGTEHGLPVLPQPQPIMLPQPLQPHTSSQAARSTTADRVQGQPIMLPDKDRAPGTGVMHPLAAYQPDSIESPPGDVALQSPSADGKGEIRQAAQGTFALDNAETSAGTLRTGAGADVPVAANERDMARPYGSGTGVAADKGASADQTPAHGLGSGASIALDDNAVQSAINPQVAASSQKASIAAANPAFTAFSTATAAQPGETPLLHPQMASGSVDGITSTINAGSAASMLAAADPPPAAFVQAVDEMPFVTARADRHATSADAPMGVTAAPGSPALRSMSDGGAVNANHPAIPTATARVVATAQTLARGATAELQLRLRPPDLGAVQVILRRSAGGDLTVQLIPATHAAADALGANLHHLRAALEAHSPGQHADVTLHTPPGESDARQHASGQHRAPQHEEDAVNPTPPAASPTRASTGARVPTRTGSGVDYTA